MRHTKAFLSDRVKVFYKELKFSLSLSHPTRRTVLHESSTYRPPFPFGETFIDRRSGHDYDNVYKFNGKELDAETGLYYYGARYYQPQISRWLSVDPLAEKYPGWSPYNYTADNPVMLVDPTGMKVDSTFTLKPNGEIVPLDDKKYYDENGREMDKIVAEETGESMLIETDVLQTRKKIKAKYRDSDGEVKEGKIQVVETTETDKGTDLFLFMSDNTKSKLEVAYAHYNNGKNYVYTSFTDQVYGLREIDKISGGALIVHFHSHPYGSDPSPGDINNAQYYRVNKKYQTVFYIYNKRTKRFSPYDENGIKLDGVVIPIKQRKN